MSVFDKPLIQYCVSIAQEFHARHNRIRAFVKHNLSSGTANEAILRQFLLEHAPKNFDVGEGFICDPTQENKVSRQCDILVYDQGTYPLVYSDGPVKIAWVEATRMVIESKTQFCKNDIKSALENIESVRQMDDRIIGAIFAFQSISLEKVCEHLREFLPKIAYNCNPMSILLLDKGVVICRTAASEYKIYKSKDEKDGGTIVIVYLLLSFFAVVWGSRPKYVDARNTGHLNIVPLLQEILQDSMDEIESITYNNQVEAG